MDAKRRGLLAATVITPVAIGDLTVGFQIYTELLFTEASHEIGRAGAHLIAAPRATGGHRRWPADSRESRRYYVRLLCRFREPPF